MLTPMGSENARFNIMSINDYNNGTEYTFTDGNAIKTGEWSVPHRSEWASIAGQLGITSSNYSGYGLKKVYWVSYAHGQTLDYCINFERGMIVGRDAGTFPIRLVRTF